MVGVVAHPFMQFAIAGAPCGGMHQALIGDMAHQQRILQLADQLARRIPAPGLLQHEYLPIAVLIGGAENGRQTGLRRPRRGKMQDHRHSHDEHGHERHGPIGRPAAGIDGEEILARPVHRRIQVIVGAGGKPAARSPVMNNPWGDGKYG